MVQPVGRDPSDIHSRPLAHRLEALKNGDFSSRVALRRGDAFEDVAHDLNELAELLAEQAKRDGS